MAITQILTTDTLEQMRVKVNTLAQNDFGDPALLGPAGIAATSVVGAVIELSSAVFSAAGFGIEDVTSTFQQILPGERLKVLGTSNQINAVVSVPDTLTVSLTPNVTISGNFTTFWKSAIMEFNYSNPDSEISALALNDYKAALAGNRQLVIYLDAMRV